MNGIGIMRWATEVLNGEQRGPVGLPGSAQRQLPLSPFLVDIISLGYLHTAPKVDTKGR